MGNIIPEKKAGGRRQESGGRRQSQEAGVRIQNAAGLGDAGCVGAAGAGF
jgi:hypothetical protein